MNRGKKAVANRRTDAQLLKAARVDADAFHVFYERYAQKTYSFFERRTRSREASLDLTAETFARVWLSRGKFRDLADGSAAPWLFAIARRVLIASVERHALETRARERLGLNVEREPGGAEPEPAWVEDLAVAMDSLPSSHRQAVELHVVHDLSYGQLAAGLGCSETAARIRVSRGLAALRHAMGGEAQ
jgi:RNA polymerase sigma factor (sigma-70 family)